MASIAPRSAASTARDHFVQFYERDEVLVEQVAEYLNIEPDAVDGGPA